MYLEINKMCAGSISSLDDMSFSPMAHALSKGDSDLSAVANGMFLDAEPGRSSEVSLCCYAMPQIAACTDMWLQSLC